MKITCGVRKENTAAAPVRSLNLPSDPQDILLAFLTRKMLIDQHRRARLECRLYFIPVKVLTGELASPRF
jgi:hypothetical protein